MVIPIRNGRFLGEAPLHARRSLSLQSFPCPLCVSMDPVIPKYWEVFGQWFQTTAQKPIGVRESVSLLPPAPRVSESVGLAWGSRTCVSETPRAARAGPGPHTGGWARPWGDAVAGGLVCMSVWSLQ